MFVKACLSSFVFLALVACTTAQTVPSEQSRETASSDIHGFLEDRQGDGVSVAVWNYFKSANVLVGSEKAQGVNKEMTVNGKALCEYSEDVGGSSYEAQLSCNGKPWLSGKRAHEMRNLLVARRILDYVGNRPGTGTAKTQYYAVPYPKCELSPGYMACNRPIRF